jgi:hypothetical protein
VPYVDAFCICLFILLFAADGELFIMGSNDSAMLARRPKPYVDSNEPPPAAAAAGAAAVADPMEGVEGQTQGTMTMAGVAGGGGVTGASDYSYTPVRVAALETQPLSDAACGLGHMLVVTRKVIWGFEGGERGWHVV